MSVSRPRWVTDLEQPPAARGNKNAAFPDPPGFPGSGALASGGKVCQALAEDARISGQVGQAARLTRQPQKQSKDGKAVQQRAPPTAEEMDTLKLKKAWEVALGPIKSLPMTAIMMYMSGNSLQIFSIMMVFMAFKNPLMGIAATNQAFARFETDTNRARMVQVKLAYVLMQLLALAVGIWKVNAMGLLP